MLWLAATLLLLSGHVTLTASKGVFYFGGRARSPTTTTPKPRSLAKWNRKTRCAGSADYERLVLARLVGLNLFFLSRRLSMICRKGEKQERKHSICRPAPFGNLWSVLGGAEAMTSEDFLSKSLQYDVAQNKLFLRFLSRGCALIIFARRWRIPEIPRCPSIMSNTDTGLDEWS